MNYLQHLAEPPTQFDKVRSDQVQNSDGAYVFQVDCFKRLERFLILGTEGGTYYATERKLTRENAACVVECLDKDVTRTLATIVDVSTNGRAPKQSPGILALAIAASHGSAQNKNHALAHLGDVCRTASTLFEFISYVDAMRGWGPGLRGAVNSWYQELSTNDLTYQVTKYRQRNGWSHRDVFRKTHPPTPRDPTQQALMRWAAGADLGPRVVTRKSNGVAEAQLDLRDFLPARVRAFEELQTLNHSEKAAEIIRTFGMTHEMVPNHLKNDPVIWSALVPGMPMGALVRNLGKLTAIGLIGSSGSAVKDRVLEQLSSAEAIKRSRLHPMAFLAAFATYGSGAGVKGKLTWNASVEVTAALEQAFYLAFGNVRPTNKRLLLALDVSPSMHGGEICGIPRMTPAVAAAAMALITLRVEPKARVVAFAARSLAELSVNQGTTLNQILKSQQGVPWDHTDLALPFLWARETGQAFDGFSVYTDNETNASTKHPYQALRDYRRSLSVPARLAVVAFTSTGFTIADPEDSGMLDVVGFDTSTPNVMSDFFSDGSQQSVETSNEEVDSDE